MQLVVVVDGVDLDYLERLRRDRNIEVATRTLATTASFAAGALAATGTLGSTTTIGGGAAVSGVLVPLAMITGMGVLFSADKESRKRDKLHREVQRESIAAIDAIDARPDFDLRLADKLAAEVSRLPGVRLAGEPVIIRGPHPAAERVRVDFHRNDGGRDLLLLTVRRGVSSDLGAHYIVTELRLFARDAMPLAYYWQPFVRGSGKRRSPVWTDYPVFRKGYADIVSIAVPGASKHPDFVENERKRLTALISEAKSAILAAKADDRARRLARSRKGSGEPSTTGRSLIELKRELRSLKEDLKQVAEYEYETEAGLRDLATRVVAKDAALYRQVQEQSMTIVATRLGSVFSDVAPARSVKRLPAE